MVDHTSSGAAVPRDRAASPVARAAGSANRALVLFESTAIVLLLVALVIAVFTQVVSRYIINVSNSWTEESARYFFVWVSMLGAALGVQRHSHFGFDAVVRGLPPLGKRLAGVAAFLVTFGMAGLLVVQGWRLMELGRLETGSATEVPMPWIYAAIPVGGLLIMMHLVLSLLEGDFDRTGGNGGHAC